ncbi:hypothetical protein TURU_017473 [Turdus rufiventris]|nr:hypothetical protein TURU_017473 [Turdus rufiventris]
MKRGCLRGDCEPMGDLCWSKLLAGTYGPIERGTQTGTVFLTSCSIILITFMALLWTCFNRSMSLLRTGELDTALQVTMCHSLGMAFSNLVLQLNDSKLEAGLTPPSHYYCSGMERITGQKWSVLGPVLLNILNDLDDGAEFSFNNFANDAKLGGVTDDHATIQKDPNRLIGTS